MTLSNADAREMDEKAKSARAVYEAMSPIDKALHDVRQRQSFVRGQAGRDAPSDALAAEVIRLRAELAARDQGRGMGEWRPMETAPKDGTPFLCRWTPIKGPSETIIARWIDDMPWVGFHGVNVSGMGGAGSIASLTGGFPEASLLATHWMPLPAAPTLPVGGDHG